MSSISRVFRKFPKTFWLANTMELFERWGWYGFYMLLANYLTKSTDIGALGFSQEKKSFIMGIGTMVLYFLPVITGTIADRYGYKKVLFIAFIIYITGFLVMPYCDTYGSFLSVFLYVAIGGALFKPIITATVSKTTDSETSSIGFGIYYMMVNVGAFIGPIVALNYTKMNYDALFYLSAIFMAINLPVLFFYKEPERERSAGNIFQSIKTILKNIAIALSDIRLLLFLLIVSGFWAMYYQLFITLPTFIDQWVDTSRLLESINSIWPWLASKISSGDGTIKAEYLTNVDALYIIFFQVLVSAAIMKWKPLSSMITGFFVCSLGMSLTILTNNPYFILGSIFIFGLGEMAGSPKINEYIGKIAPRDKVALYMGCAFLPVALGSFLAGLIGSIYGKVSDKIILLQKDLSAKGLSVPEISDNFTKSDLYDKGAKLLNMSQKEMTQYLWDTYHPNQIWLVLLGVGTAASLLLFIYDRLVIRKIKN